jgi:hypothetical protein
MSAVHMECILVLKYKCKDEDHDDGACLLAIADDPTESCNLTRG